MSDFKYINTTAIEEISGGDQDLTIDIISMFLEGAPELLLDIQNNLAQNNYQEIATSAHKLRPMFAYVGANNIMKTIGEIETQCNDNQLNEMLSARISDVENEMAEIVNELNALMSNLVSN